MAPEMNVSDECPVSAALECYEKHLAHSLPSVLKAKNNTQNYSNGKIIKYLEENLHFYLEKVRETMSFNNAFAVFHLVGFGCCFLFFYVCSNTSISLSKIQDLFH